ncbi:MAG: hypothetical protein AAGI01_18390, partial [Myxococcota bacterium]
VFEVCPYEHSLHLDVIYDHYLGHVCFPACTLMGRLRVSTSRTFLLLYDPERDLRFDASRACIYESAPQAEADAREQDSRRKE